MLPETLHGAARRRNIAADPDLLAVADAWPSLPDHIKVAIVLLAKPVQ